MKRGKRSTVWFGIILFIMAAVFSCGDNVILVEEMGGGGNNGGNDGGGGGGGNGGGASAPVIWGENVNRTSNESATISFMVDGIGTAYYLARTSGAPAPTNSEVVLNGAPLGTVSGGGNATIRLAAGAQDVYLVVVDAVGNMSPPLKIPVPPINTNPSAPYIITESGLPKAADNAKSRLFKTANAAATSFKVTNGGRQIATGTIQNVLNAVRDAANGASVTVQFGNGTSTLDIGSASARLENSGSERWGAIRLTGKLRGSGANTNTGVIYVNVTVNIIVAGYVENTSGGNAIYNNTPRPIIVEPGANIVGEKYNLDGNEGGGVTDPCVTNPNAAGCGGGTPVVTTFTDSRDNKTYKKVQIGTQTWMAENLNYDASGSACYDNDPANCGTYGRLYGWVTAQTACPVGWHLPSGAEWTALTDFVGANDGTKLKSSTGWDSSTEVPVGADVFGFSALAGGRDNNGDGYFATAGYYGTWWTATEGGANGGEARYMFADREYVGEYGGLYYDKAFRFSVRCAQD